MSTTKAPTADHMTGFSITSDSCEHVLCSRTPPAVYFMI
jgi:hypothetical protein